MVVDDQKIVSRERYFDYRYLQRHVFLAYYHQINEVIKLKPKTVLEVGCGNNFLKSILQNYGIKVTTVDFNKNLEPDIVADIRKLPFKDNSFDVVVACEIIEHIPFVDVPKAMQELRRISKDEVIMSFPYACVNLEGMFALFMPFVKSKYPKFSFRIPYSWFTGKDEHESHPYHYWAVGRKDYSKKRILNLIQKYFIIKKSFFEDLNSGHWFFVLSNFQKLQFQKETK